MALHRDIYWLGRQWTVTGHGLQLIDQKLKGFFDIEASRLWEDALIENMRAKGWLNLADFDKGLAIARARYPEGTSDVQLSPTPVLPVDGGSRNELPLRKLTAPKVQAATEIPSKIEDSKSPNFLETDPAEPPDTPFCMEFSGIAKFVRPWRIALANTTMQANAVDHD